MLYKTLYFIQGKLLGQSEVECDFQPHCMAYVCASCGEIWARVVVDCTHPYWDFQNVPCERHVPRSACESWRVPPGSLFYHNFYSKRCLSKIHWAVALEHLPVEVLKREFELHWKRLEGYQNDNT